MGEEDKNTESKRASLHSTEELRAERYTFPKATDKAEANPTEESSACRSLSVKLDSAPIQAPISSTFC